MISVPDNVSYSRSHLAITVLAAQLTITVCLCLVFEILPDENTVRCRILYRVTQFAGLDSALVNFYVAIPRTTIFILTVSINPLMFAQ